MYRYAFIEDDEARDRLGEDAWAAVAKAIAALAEQLRLDGLAVRWFDRVETPVPDSWVDGPMTGFAKSSQLRTANVSLEGITSPEDVIRRIAHEARHLHQWEHQGFERIGFRRTVDEHMWAEVDCDRFEYAFVERFFQRQPAAPVLIDSVVDKLRDEFSAVKTMFGM